MLPLPLAADPFGSACALAAGAGTFATAVPGLFSTGFLARFSSGGGAGATLAGGGAGATLAGGAAATFGGAVLGWAVGTGAGCWRYGLIPTANARMVITAR